MAIPRAIVTSEEPDALQVQLAGAILVEQFPQNMPAAAEKC